MAQPNLTPDIAMSLVSGNNAIDSLVFSSWSGSPGVPASVTYQFLTSPPSGADAGDRNGFKAMTAVQKQAVREAFAQWSSVANITFTEVTSGANIRLGTNYQGDTSSGYSYLPEPEKGITQVELYLNNAGSYNNDYTPGAFGPSVLLHEIGHTLGLKHPGDYNSTGEAINGPFLPTATDNLDYTQMSYRQSVTNRGTYPVTPMLYDIQAIQYLYGANMSYHAGNDAYKFTDSQAPLCIWDAGGYNTFDFSTCSGYTVIDLHAGAFSSTRPSVYNVSIAYNVTVQAVVTGAGGSTVRMNDAGDALAGGSGVDLVYVGGGDDAIDGGNGVDTVVFSGNFASYTVARAGGTVVVTGQGRDTLTGVEILQFADRTVNVLDLVSQVAGGTNGNDRFVAQAGNEYFDGGIGVDTVVYGGLRAGYAITAGTAAAGASGPALQVDGIGGTDTLVSIERLVFDDGALAFDTGGVAAQAYRLYRAAFDRAPDEPGLGFWITQMDRGIGLIDVSRSFVGSPEFRQKYGDHPTDAAFVDLLYQNVLHRAGETGGVTFWNTMLGQGVSRADVLAAFSESPENVAATASLIANGINYVPWLS